ncbi:GntR family transcriptional regulator [Streptomyces sp. SID5910]|uniref:GntR family transcriptional regulator n=1 Tax=Streptomyces sp. SID5910 TaxID=2690312 RepID=UPI0013701429|nr:GntR family transcriptional regulator [Streptomyces sp. SID5910]MYR46119.1 GntR family transcriptional regulator [Streptomyces sp. SID5910]
MLITIDPAARTSLAEQIAACVRRGLADGTLRRGERLPGARALAATLGVNMHTVLRAYQQLNDERLIELRPRRGAVVTTSTPTSRAVLIEACRRVVQLSRAHGLTQPETLALVEQQFRAHR